jgi:hypothetical protein
VDYRRNHDGIAVQSINNAIAIDQQLTDILVIEFRNFASGAGKRGQRFRSEL